VKIHDISQTLRKGMVVWPGDPPFRHHQIQQLKEGADSNVSALEMGVHTGTHIDVPLHLNPSGLDTARMPVSPFLGPARVYSVSVNPCIRAEDLSMLDWSDVERALFKTRFSDSSGSSFERGFIYFHEDAAEFLVSRGVLLVGTDAPSVDAFESKELPVHRTLLGHEIAILENACLESVCPGDYELICLPLKLSGSDGSPVRAILRK
jgi:arylformamidase